MCLPVCLGSFPSPVLASGASNAAPAGTTRRGARGVGLDTVAIQAIVDDFRARLAIPNEVQVAIIPKNPRVVSVEPLRDRTGPFQLALEDGFLDMLSEDELRAAIAHELGHVWIFTHHPYLQTERLANRVALRLVSRDSLGPVYEKMWKRMGTTGDLTQFLGAKPEPTASLSAR